MAERQLQLPDGIPPLWSYYAYLTGGCNLACKHCWIAPTFQPHGDTGGHLDYKLFELAIDEGLPLGLSKVKLTGGEPLLHPDFIRMVDLLREKELGLTIETNGVLMTEKLARYLKEKSTLEHISISLDGTNPETHDTFRGVKGSFEKSYQAVRHLVTTGFRPQVIMSIHEGNVDEIEPLIKLAESLGAGSVKFNIIQLSGRGEILAQREQVLGIERLVGIGKWIEKYLQKTAGIPLHYSWPMAFYSLKHLQTFSGYSCNIFNTLGILSTGHLAMCGIGTQVPEMCYGELGKDRVADLWANHPTLAELRRSLPNDLEGVCQSCIFRERCMGVCVALNYHSGGKLTAPNWFCREAQLAGIFPTSKLRSAQLSEVKAL
jgi:SynChlorMet cassette radical SAM/SPASM protein ScmF